MTVSPTPPLLKMKINIRSSIRPTWTTYDSLNSKVESDLSCVPVGVLAGLE